jgi:pimeloyl-ACP methyl ester carboxylesterase
LKVKKDTRWVIIILVAIPILLVLILSIYRKREEAKPAALSGRYEHHSLESRILSNFRHSSVFLNYAVILPRAIVLNRKYPVIIHIPAFGEDHRISKVQLKRIQALMDLRTELEAIHVFVDPNGPHGHHYFVDSQKNGMVGTALVQELLPEIKKTLPVGKIFLTGHSSGGWSALWLQLEFPEVFSGVWATSPDPIDFKNFYGIDLTSDSEQNFYTTDKGVDRKAIRGRSTLLKNFVEEELKENPQGNEWIAMEAAFSEIDPNGAPRELFDRKTGKLDRAVAKSWERYDLSRRLSNLAPERLESLKGKLHLFCGSKDDYFLDAPFLLFCRELKKLAIDGTCELIDGKGHNSIYQPSKIAPDGLVMLIWQEIAQMNNLP